MTGNKDGFRERLGRSSEEALSRIAEDLLARPAFHTVLARAFEAREQALRAQKLTMSALNIPSAADIERLTRRVRLVGHRLEGIEELLDRLIAQLGDDPAKQLQALDKRLAAIESKLEQPATTRRPAAKKTTSAK